MSSIQTPVSCSHSDIDGDCLRPAERGRLQCSAHRKAASRAARRAERLQAPLASTAEHPDQSAPTALQELTEAPRGLPGVLPDAASSNHVIRELTLGLVPTGRRPPGARGVLDELRRARALAADNPDPIEFRSGWRNDLR